MRAVKKLFWNMLLLTATSLVLRTVGVAFSVYLSGCIGTEGVGLFQLIMSVYMLFVTIASSGIRFATTRLISEEDARGPAGSVRQAMRCCLFYAALFGCGALLLLFFAAPLIGSFWIADTRAIPSLRLLSFSLPFLSITASVSGYFVAVRKMTRCAFIQLLEQLVRICVAVFGLHTYRNAGLVYACLAISAGSCASELFSALSLSLLCRLDFFSRRGREHTSNGICRRLCGVALPIAFSAYARSALSTLQNLLIPRGLAQYGLGRTQAMSAYGMVHGMVLPVILYPSALFNVLSELLLPELTESQIRGWKRHIHYILTRVFRMSFLFTAGVMGIFLFFAEELSFAIYQRGDPAFYMRIFAPLVLIMYMDTIVDGMLKGLGEQLNSMKYNIIDSLTSVILIYLLLPVYGVNGYIVTVMVTEILNFTLSLHRLVVVTGFHPKLLMHIAKPLLCVFCSAAILFLLPAEHLAFGLRAALFLLLYILLLLFSGALTREDFRWGRGLLH